MFVFSFLLIFNFFLYSYVAGRERVVSKFLPFLYSLRTVSLFLFYFYSFHSGILFRLLNLVCHVRFPPLWAGSTLRPSFYSTLLFHTAEMERNVYRTIQQGRVVYISTTWYGADRDTGGVRDKQIIFLCVVLNARKLTTCLPLFTWYTLCIWGRPVYKVAAAMTATKPNQMFRVVQQNNRMMERL